MAPPQILRRAIDVWAGIYSVTPRVLQPVLAALAIATGVIVVFEFGRGALWLIGKSSDPLEYDAAAVTRACILAGALTFGYLREHFQDPRWLVPWLLGIASSMASWIVFVLVLALGESIAFSAVWPLLGLGLGIGLILGFCLWITGRRRAA